MEYSDLILVTWDFTEKSVFALEHAINLGKHIRHDIAIIHVVKKDSEIEKTKKQISDEIMEKFANTGVTPNIIVRSGNIFLLLPK